ncbi:peptidylprolyl isomerase [Rhodobacter sp. SY28-1]|uniref:peptidylprolyl isomerase n=1 Tax=Rhodobacter sp. SY28-1 TaxID=2562317 RepID=UPI0010BFAFA9|nr:peptidylprolyl isomerase [Rhodobacter sp. SY28-1]
MSRKLALAALLALASPAVAQDAIDGPGPNLVIEVAGAANGTLVIDLLPDVAPQHVAQITALAKEGAYDGVVFHRVIDGFMAQTGDVQYGKSGGDLSQAGMGGSSKPDLPAEFSDLSYTRGVVGMARSQDPNSANSQFFIMFTDGVDVDGQRRLYDEVLKGAYTVVGNVVSGMEVVDAIQRGEPPAPPDVMTKVTVQE